jgi:membrane protein
MGITHFLKKAFYLYYDGFRQMTLGKTLWMIILLKLFIMFAVLKVFFFPNYIGSKTQHGGEPTFVNEQLKQRIPK